MEKDEYHSDGIRCSDNGEWTRLLCLRIDQGIEGENWEKLGERCPLVDQEKSLFQFGIVKRLVLSGNQKG